MDSMSHWSQHLSALPISPTCTIFLVGHLGHDPQQLLDAVGPGGTGPESPWVTRTSGGEVNKSDQGVHQLPLGVLVSRYSQPFAFSWTLKNALIKSHSLIIPHFLLYSLVISLIISYILLLSLISYDFVFSWLINLPRLPYHAASCNAVCSRLPRYLGHRETDWLGLNSKSDGP